MPKVQLIEVILRLLPEQLLSILGCYTLTKTQMNLKRYFLSVSIGSVLSYLIKLLPIQTGINTVLYLGVLISLNILVNKIKFAKAIQSSILIITILFVTEAINVIILKVLNVDIITVFKNPVTKHIYGLPSLILFCIYIFAAGLLNSKKKSTKQLPF
jgi:hypothetical protein